MQNRDRFFYVICFGFIFGVFLRSFVSLDSYFTILFGIISFATFLFFTLISKNNLGIICSVFVLFFCFGIIRFNINEKEVSEFLEMQVGQSVSLTGEIVDEPTISENNQKLIIKTVFKEVSQKTVFWEPVKILVSTSFVQDFKYGDIIDFSGKLEKPQNFTTDQGKVFDYVNYLHKDGVFYVLSYGDVEIISRDNGSKIKSILFFVKNKFLEKLNLVIGSPESLLLGGLILGEKSAFSEELRQNFVNTGTIHIVALSGYNVTIVAEWFMSFFAFLPQTLGVGVGILAILLFILMTGGSSTAIRAGIMATLALIARATGRNYDVARALILAGVFMIFFNPLILVYDVSFQLSFIATVAVIFFAPKIEKYFLWVPKHFGLRDIVSVTSAAYIFVFPFILYKMGNFSVVALPANILILPFIPFTMLLGFLTSFVGMFSYIISVPIGYITYLFLHYELGVVNLFANLSFSSFSIPNFPLFLTILIYMYFIYKLFGRSIQSFFSELS